MWSHLTYTASPDAENIHQVQKFVSGYYSRGTGLRPGTLGMEYIDDIERNHDKLSADLHKETFIATGSLADARKTHPVIEHDASILCAIL